MDFGDLEGLPEAFRMVPENREGVQFTMQNPLARARFSKAGFTLLEIAGVIVILGILATLGMPLMAKFRARADAVQCASNLTALGLGVSSYMEDHKSWPQIARAPKTGGEQSSMLSAGAQAYASQWIETLEVYGISEKVWHCPSVEKQIRQNADPSVLKKKRIDYNPTIFDTRPESPRQWPKHPWFIERSSLHPDGPNILFADGSVATFNQVVKSIK